VSLPRNAGSSPPDDRLVEMAVRAAAVERDGCPDPEVLGLYVERAIDDAAERATVGAHVDDCARCQAIVADFVRALPDEAPGEGAGAPAGAAGWLSGWRWLVPLVSAAAVGIVAVWIGRSPSDDVAEEGRAVAADATFESAPAGAITAEPAAGPPPVSSIPPLPDSGRRRDRTDSPAVDAAAKAVTTPPAASVAAAQADRELRNERMAADLPPPPVAVVPESAELPAPVEAGAGLGRQRATAPSEATAGTAGAAPASPPAAARAESASAFRTENPARWRIRDGRVERSLDQGRSWTRVELPTSETMTTVSVRGDGTVAATSSTGGVWTSSDQGATWTRTP
jgi:hypothetical protein